MQRVSWEVDYEDRSKLRDLGGLDLHENEYDIGVALSSASEEEGHLRAEESGHKAWTLSKQQDGTT